MVLPASHHVINGETFEVIPDWENNRILINQEPHTILGVTQDFATDHQIAMTIWVKNLANNEVHDVKFVIQF